jgi:ketosteroid isomerase-like protein
MERNEDTTMNRPRLLAALLLAACVAASPLLAFGQSASPPSADDAALRRQIANQYAQISAAFRRKDARGMMVFATPDFTVRTPDGRVLSRAQAQQNVQQNVDTIRTVQRDQYTIDRMDVRGDGATAVCHVTERSVVAFNDTRGEFGPVGKSHALDVTTRYRDTWINTGPESWRMKRSEMLSTRILLDGRPYRPSRTRPKRP